MAGYIKVDRKLANWRYYADSNTKSLFLHCLIKANFKDKKWKGIDIPKGSFVTSKLTLSEELKLDRKTIERCLRKLDGDEITVKVQPKQWTMITVNNYENYQTSDNDRDNDRDITKNVLRIKELKECKECKENTNTVSPIIPLNSPEKLFGAFWSVYPKKVNRQGCEVAYKRIKHLAEEQGSIIADVLKQKQSKQWLESGGQYIPNPLTYIHQERWKSTREQTPSEKFESAGISEEWFK